MKLSLFYKNVTIIDYAYLDDHLGAVGNALHVDVEFVGETDEEGIIFDFSLAKNKVKKIIDRDCDHRLVVPNGIVEFEGDQFKMNFGYGHQNQMIEYRGPAEGICEIPASNVNLGTLRSYLEDIVLKEMPKNISAVRLTLREEELPEGAAVFHYTHGLKDHYGNCQRLLHGHRNTVKVWVNNARHDEFEHKLANEHFSGNIHFCFFENIVNKEEVKAAFKGNAAEGRITDPNLFVEIEYKSSQGVFWGRFPSSMIYLMPIESTVENLSTYFCQVVKSWVKPHEPVAVEAYEGIAKGAITTL